MNIARAAIAGLGGMVAYFVFGGVVFGLFPFLRSEFARYSDVYRSEDAMKAVMPIGMAAMLVAIVVVAVLFALTTLSNRGLLGGIEFGALVGLFVVCAFVLHNHVNLNVGWKLTAQQAVIYFVQWLLVCGVIGAIYRPAAAS